MNEQRTESWFLERAGKVTASRIADVCARTKTGYGASRANYMSQLIIERLTGQPADSYINAAMQWGIDHEDDARIAYEFMTDNTVEKVGFIEHPNIKDAGASPDGRVGKEGLVEFKCPNSATHIDFLLTGKIPDKYIKQMLWQMECDNRGFCDFFSYDPRMPANLQAFRKRVFRDEYAIKKIRCEVHLFLEELEEKLKQLNKVAA